MKIYLNFREKFFFFFLLWRLLIPSGKVFIPLVYAENINMAILQIKKLESQDK